LTCVRDAPSQPAGVPVAPPSPSFPFQYVVGDYFSLAVVNYLILGDRFSGWLSIYEAGKGEFDAKWLAKNKHPHARFQEITCTDGLWTFSQLSITSTSWPRTSPSPRITGSGRWPRRGSLMTRSGVRRREDLEIGTPVALQNQTGNNPNKWDKTVIVLENKPHSQVLIRVDGSRRVTLRNRRFVRRLDPTLWKTENPRTVMREPVKKPPTVQREHV
jgi:hypothetical protein